MNRCTECNFPLDEGLLACPQCGAEVADMGQREDAEAAPSSDNEQTVNVSDTVDFSDSSPTSPTDASKKSAPQAAPADKDQADKDQADKAQDHDSPSRGEGNQPGTGTVSAPGVSGDAKSAKDQDADEENWEDADELNQTIDAGLTELDEADDFEFDDDFPGVQSDYEADTGHATTVFADGGLAGEPQEEPVASGDEPDIEATDLQKTLELGPEVLGDDHGTLAQTGSEDFPDEFRTLDSDNQRTINAFEQPTGKAGEPDPNATHIAEDSEQAADGSGRLTIDVAGEDQATQHGAVGRATVDAGSDDHATNVVPSGEHDANAGPSDDNAGTVVLPGGKSAVSPGDKTVVYESTDTGNSTVEASATSGTEGRLKRLWEGVAGSSENPMHSLQAVGQQASDSVFQRVATRRVADASTSQDVAADYQIVDKLGEGAMGIVFSARQTAVNRIVAIKTAKPSFQANDDSRRRFLYEAHITADLDHSNIVPIHELGASEEGMLFYSMKLVQGTEWSRVMRKKSREQNLEIFMKVTDAMAFAHSKGVIHRDLKPENTMLGRFGEVFVTDWGTAINLDKDTTFLAKPASKGDKFLTVEDGSNFIRGDSILLHDGVEAFDRVQIVSIDDANRNRLYLRKKLTRDYQPSRRLRVVKAMNLAGTPCYMAPEMAGHQLPKIGKTSDIYILGAILYDLVTGKPPHTGDSVTQCLRAALKNEIVVIDNDDALLTIAYKAMSTDPASRYQSVEELQDAVREYRRHAESITLSERSDELLDQAIEKKDYEAFSRTLFGYRDAIELWPENTGAVSGLKKARLAFGEVAYAKGDYDLVLQTLDQDVPAEASLFGLAVQAKKKAEGREKSLRLLQKVVAAIILFAITGLSALAWVANDQKNIAVAARDDANRAASQEKQAKIIAEKAEAAARLAKETAESALASEKAAKEAEEIQRLAAEKSAAEAITQQMNALASEAVAIKEREAADEAKLAAEEAAQLAQRRSAQIQLGEYNSSLALAKSQIESFDLAAGVDNLRRLENMFGLNRDNSSEPANDVFFGNTPKIDTWGWQRIELLSNSDLPKAYVGDEESAPNVGSRLETQVTASAYSTQANLAVVGTQQGLVQILKYESGELQKSHALLESGAKINAVAISPDGTEVVFGYSRGDESGVKRWEISQDDAQAVQATQKRQFQYFAYSADGRQVLAGISGGVWLWDRIPDWYTAAQPTERISIRGELTNLQPLDEHRTLLTTRFQDKETLIAVLDHQTRKIQIVSTDEQSAPDILSAAPTAIANQVVLGLTNNRLLVGTLPVGATQISDLLELDDKHRAPVTQIVSNGRNRLITSSESEPVAHVWQYNSELAAWEYDTYLTGTPKNIVGVGLLGEQQVLAVDSVGTSIVWNVERQKQRRRLQRQTNQQDIQYLAPIRAVVAGTSQDRAIAIDENGVVDLWSLTDGQTVQVDGDRWSYFGHTPGAELVNSAIDMEQGVVITAASLQNAKKEYLADPSHLWEFCVWDAQSGEMQRRWSAPKRMLPNDRVESIEQRVSLVDSGRQLLFASDNETRLVELSSGRETFVRTDFGSYFATPNPINPALVMLVKRSGAVRLLNLRDPSSWEDPGLRNFKLADPSDIPLQGLWSADGQRYFLTFSTGGLAVFRWDGNQLDLAWSTRTLQDSPYDSKLIQALSVDSGRIQSHLDVDLALTGTSADETLTIATRKRGLNASTKLTVVGFSDQKLQPTLVQSSSYDAVQWLQQVGDQRPSLTPRIHDLLIVDAARIRSRLRIRDQIFVSTTSAQVVALTDGQPRVTSYGRARLVSATGSQDGRTLWSLLEDGSLWRFTMAGESGAWSRMSYSALGATQIRLAPNGEQLLIVQQQRGIIVEPLSGRLLQDLGEIQAAAWDPTSLARLAICRPDSTLEILAEGQTRKLPEKPVLADRASVLSLNFFNEVWENPTLPTRQFLLVHSQGDTQGHLQFIPIDPAPQGAADAAGDVQEIPVGTRLAVSPAENILVTGAPGGTVAVWFATPTYDRRPHHLFELEGHRGEDLSCIAFSSDGQTIVTADTKNRLFAWLSRDPLAKP